MRNFVIINGVNSNTINGLGINELPPITKPEMRNIREEIDGRDGDITTNLGYSAYDKTITIGLFGTGYDINDIVAFFNGEGTIVFSNEQDKYYNFKILNQIDYESLQKFRTASITFHCQPFKYPLSETPLEIEYDYIEDEGETLTLNNTGNATMKMDLKGNTSQSGTPTPTSPIPVSVVSDDNDVVVCGKNIIDLSNPMFTDMILRPTGIVDGWSGVSDVSQYIDVLPNTQYSLSINTNDSNSRRIAFYKKPLTSEVEDNTRFISYSEYSGNSATFTTPNECNYIRIAYYNELTTIQLEKGTATSYEPYQSQTYEVDLFNSANIFDGVLELGGYENNGVKDTRTDRYRSANKIQVRPNTQYTFSINGVLQNYVVVAYQRNGTFISIGDTSSGTYTTPSNCYYIAFRCYIADFTNDYATLKVQIQKGETATAFEDYSPIELCKIGNYQDYFYKDGDKWYLHKVIGKVVFTGGNDEIWNISETSTSGSNRFLNESIANLVTKPSADSVTINTLSNNFVAKSANQTYSNQEGIDISRNGNLHIYSDTTKNYTVAQFKTWLSTHNTIVYYPSATPTNTEITDSTLISQLDNIQNAMSYEGTTNIGQVNNDKAFIISAKALEDGTNEVVVNNIGNVYSKPLLALEGNGNVDIYLDNTQILKANVEDKMNIDIAQLEAYNPDTMTLLNRQVIGNYNSMTLQPGNNTIRIDGALDKATITNYTRWL